MKGICFIEPLFHKVVKGEKTQTRRIINPQPDERGLRTTNIMFENYHGKGFLPKYKVGEVVYLKEPYAETCDEYGSPLIAYRFDNTALYLVRKDENGDYYQLNTIKKPVTTNWTIHNFPACGEWKNKLFMPGWAARYFIEITAVRVERLQDISDEDCMKEGICPKLDGLLFVNEVNNIAYPTPKRAYAALINEINGKGTWEKNPWVWVYDFELINK